MRLIVKDASICPLDGMVLALCVLYQGRAGMKTLAFEQFCSALKHSYAGPVSMGCPTLNTVIQLFPGLKTRYPVAQKGMALPKVLTLCWQLLFNPWNFSSKKLPISTTWLCYVPVPNLMAENYLEILFNIAHTVSQEAIIPCNNSQQLTTCIWVTLHRWPLDGHTNINSYSIVQIK